MGHYYNLFKLKAMKETIYWSHTFFHESAVLPRLLISVADANLKMTDFYETMQWDFVVYHLPSVT